MARAEVAKRQGSTAQSTDLLNVVNERHHAQPAPPPGPYPGPHMSFAPAPPPYPPFYGHFQYNVLPRLG